jgi:hypothetical protein
MKEEKGRSKKNRKEEWERENIVKKRMCRDVGAGTGICLTMVVIVLALCVFAQSALAAQISVEPAYLEVSPGENFTVDITVDPEGSEVFAASYTLYFNNTLLNATELTQGTFLSQDGAETYLWVDEIYNIDPTGRVEYAESRKGTSSGVSNSGVLTTITFQAIGERGVSELHLSDLDGVILSDPDCYPVQTNVSNGNVSIGLCGDVNGDGIITSLDYVTVRAYKLGKPGWTLESIWAADVNGDGDITSLDYVTIRAYKLGKPGWELNCYRE